MPREKKSRGNDFAKFRPECSESGQIKVPLTHWRAGLGYVHPDSKCIKCGYEWPMPEGNAGFRKGLTEGWERKKQEA